jgi:hypothetical protein
VLTSSLPASPLETRSPGGAGRWFADALNEAIVWLAVIPFLPWVLLERRRRRLDRQTDDGARAERALQASLRRLKASLHDSRDNEPS